jgi:hypothetical protein
VYLLRPVARRYWQHRDVEEMTFADLVEINRMIDAVDAEGEHA